MYRCDLTGILFDELVEIKNLETGNETGCPCCHDGYYEEVYPCDICGKCVDEDFRLTTGTVMCPECRQAAIITLFDYGAEKLGINEEEYLDDVLDGGCWADLKKLYREAKHAETI